MDIIFITIRDAVLGEIYRTSCRTLGGRLHDAIYGPIHFNPGSPSNHVRVQVRDPIIDELRTEWPRNPG